MSLPLIMFIPLVVAAYIFGKEYYEYGDREDLILSAIYAGGVIIGLLFMVQ